MATITIHVDDQLKTAVQSKTKKNGFTLTFLINQLLKSYNEGKVRFEMISDEQLFQNLSAELTKEIESKIRPHSLPSPEGQLADL